MWSGCIDPVGGEWSTSRPGRFTAGERAPGTHWRGGWVDLRAGLDDFHIRNSSKCPPTTWYPKQRTRILHRKNCFLNTLLRRRPFPSSRYSGSKWERTVRLVTLPASVLQNSLHGSQFLSMPFVVAFAGTLK
jgi:hypothetical protein